MRWLLFVLGISLLIACQAAESPTPTPTPSFPAPDFTLIALDETRFTLNELRGRWVILNFWATWCEPCLTEMPGLQTIADRYPKTLTVLGVNMGESQEMVATFVAEQEIHFPILINPDPATLTSYQVIGLPQTVIIDPAGHIVYRQFGPLSLLEFDSLLGKLQSKY
jgi:peroxiredoxin